MIERVEDWRTSVGLRQDEVADRFGVKVGTYSMWVSRGRMPRKYWNDAQTLVAASADGDFDAAIGDLDIPDVYKSLIKDIPRLPSRARTLIAQIALNGL